MSGYSCKEGKVEGWNFSQAGSNEVITEQYVREGDSRGAIGKNPAEDETG